MLDGRFDPALAALFAGEEANPSKPPSLSTLVLSSLAAVALAALLSWPLI